MMHSLLYRITIWPKITVGNRQRKEDVMSKELDYKALGNRLKKYRQQKHYTQENLAELANCAVSSVSHAERGTSQPSLQLLVRFCNILDITVDQLLCDSLPIASTTLEKDISELLSGCNQQELKIIKDIITVTKKTLKENK